MTNTEAEQRSLVDDDHLDTWSETDPQRRLVRIAGYWEEDGALVYSPRGGRGHDGFGALTAAAPAHYPNLVFLRSTAIDAHHDTFQVGWEVRRPDTHVALSGVDAGVLSDIQPLVRVIGFFGDLAAADGDLEETR